MKKTALLSLMALLPCSALANGGGCVGCGIDGAQMEANFLPKYSKASASKSTKTFLNFRDTKASQSAPTRSQNLIDGKNNTGSKKK